MAGDFDDPKYRGGYAADDDVHERPWRPPVSPGKMSLVQRRYGRLARAADNGGAVTPDPERLDAAARTSGQALPDDLRAQLEASSGADLSGVRVHTDGASGDAAQSIAAKAFTTGSDIFFAPGMYDPGSADGQHLVAHEVAHTVQQAGAPSTPQAKLEVSQPADSLEVEADRFADGFVDGAAPIQLSTGAPVLARAPMQAPVRTTTGNGQQNSTAGPELPTPANIAARLRDCQPTLERVLGIATTGYRDAVHTLDSRAIGTVGDQILQGLRTIDTAIFLGRNAQADGAPPSPVLATLTEILPVHLQQIDDAVGPFRFYAGRVGAGAERPTTNLIGMHINAVRRVIAAVAEARNNPDTPAKRAALSALEVDADLGAFTRLVVQQLGMPTTNAGSAPQGEFDIVGGLIDGLPMMQRIGVGSKIDRQTARDVLNSFSYAANYAPQMFADDWDAIREQWKMIAAMTAAAVASIILTAIPGPTRLVGLAIQFALLAFGLKEMVLGVVAATEAAGRWFSLIGAANGDPEKVSEAARALAEVFHAVLLAIANAVGARGIGQLAKSGVRTAGEGLPKAKVHNDKRRRHAGQDDHGPPRSDEHEPPPRRDDEHGQHPDAESEGKRSDREQDQGRESRGGDFSPPESLLDEIVEHANRVAAPGGEISPSQLAILRENLPKVQRRGVKANRAIRKDFVKDAKRLIAQWEENTGRKWPGGATPHHIIPLESGGSNKWWNLMPTYGKLPNHSLPGIPGPHASGGTLRETIQQGRKSLPPGTVTDLRKPRR